MSLKCKTLVPLLMISTLLVLANPALAKDWEVKLSVKHRSQQENWSCGPNTIAMWAGILKNASIDTMSIADKYTGGRGDGTNIPEFTNAMYQLSKPKIFAEWTYLSRFTAIKGVMYTIARFNEPVAISGNDGGHYYLIVGGVATQNPFVYYGKESKIKYVYLLDSRENSPLYTNPKKFSSAWWSVFTYPIFKKGQRYSPNEVMSRWTPIPWYNAKWRSVERVPNTKKQGATYNNKDFFFSY